MWHIFFQMVHLKKWTLLLASSLVTDVTNIDLTLPLLPFPNITLSLNFHCITGIDFLYHPLLYHNHSAWIESILHILQFYISSFHLKYVFLFNHRDSNNLCPFEILLPFIQSAIISWNSSTHLMLSNNLGDNVSCSRTFLYLSPLPLNSPSFFIRQHSPPSFPNLLPWLSSTFNTPLLAFLLQQILLMLPPHLTYRIFPTIPDVKDLNAESW